MTWRITEARTSVRQSADNPRVIEGIAIPYLQVANNTKEFGAEAFAPGAFRSSVEHWMGRTDGARMAFKPEHGARPVATITHLEDTPEGVAFRAQVFETPAGDQYLQELAAGLNGVSIEFGPGSAKPQRTRDGTTLHRDAKLHSIAGSISPAYDGARIALRDGELDLMETENDTKIPEAADAARNATVETQTRDRAQLERDSAASVLNGSHPIKTLRTETVYGPGRGTSFFRDLMNSHQGDSDAAERQYRHNAQLTDVANAMERAGDLLSSEMPGAYPNDYLPGLLTPRILKGRPFGGFFNRVAIRDAQPKIFAKVTTSTAVVVQSSEGASLGTTDLATTSVTATPLIYGASIDVSRQSLDGGDPSTEAMVIQDMVEAYAQASETVIKTAVEAGATDSGVAITAATPWAGELANVINYQAVRFTPATGVFIPSALYSTLLAQGDSTGRPFLPQVGLMNSDGSVMAGATGANILGAYVALSWASTSNVCVFARPSDYVIFESSIARFSYDQVVGPQAVRLGLWAYLVVGTRLGGLKKTAA